jgi:opacity protein-like surface antigen
MKVDILFNQCLQRTGGFATVLLGSVILATGAVAAETCDADHCAESQDVATSTPVTILNASSNLSEPQLEPASFAATDLQPSDSVQIDFTAFTVKPDLSPSLAVYPDDPAQWDLNQVKIAADSGLLKPAISADRSSEPLTPLENTALTDTPTLLANRSIDTAAEPAEDEAAEEKNDERDPWRVEIQPYLFIPFDISGDVILGEDLDFNDEFGDDDSEDRFPVEIDFNLGLSDFLELDLTQLLWFAGRLEVWNDDVGLGLIVQGAYSKIGVEQEFDRLEVDLSTETISVDVALGYNFGGPVPLRSVDQDEFAEDAEVYPSLGFELFGGARYGSITQKVEFDPGPDIDFGPEWFEPLVGGRITFNLSETLSFGVRADTSITTSDTSDENWNLFVGLDWQLSPNFSLRPAYRFYSLTVREDGPLGGRKVALEAQGLWLGLVYQF